MYFRAQMFQLAAFLMIAASALVGCSPSSKPKTAVVAPLAAVQVHPRVAGTIDRIRFEEGAQVKKGQVLFRIDPGPFRAETERRFIARNHALASLELARASQVRGARLTGDNALSQDESARLADAVRMAFGELAAATAALNASKVDLALTEVRAPIDGRASRAMISKGDWVSSESVLTTVVGEAPIAMAAAANGPGTTSAEAMNVTARLSQ